MAVPTNMRELIEMYQEDRGDQVCILWQDEEITYRRLNEMINRVANGLKAMGIRKGDVVSVYLPNCPDYFYVWFGILKLGAVFGPINALFKGDEVRHVLSDSGAVAVITSEILIDTINAAKQDCPALRHVVCLEGATKGASAYADLLQHPSELAAVDIAQGDLAAIVYTSGTTGKPKGAMISHWNYVWDTMAAAELVPVSIGVGRLGLVLPLFHANAQVTSLTQFLTGGSVALWERFSPSDFWETVDRYKPQTFSAVPTMLSILLSAPVKEGLDISSLDFVISGAAPLPLDIMLRFENAFGLRIIEGYGLTEGTCVSSLNPYWSVRKPGSIGLPIRGQAMRIVDEDLNEVPAGEYGEIVIKGPNVMQGYYNNPEATAETIVDGWLLTGDMGYVDLDGYIFIVDRKKDMIIRGGENIYPREIEEVLFTHPQIAEATVIGRKDAIWGEQVVAIVVPCAGASLIAEDVIAFCKERLADYKLPHEVIFRQDLPKTLTGKVQKKVLREELSAGKAFTRLEEDRDMDVQTSQPETEERPLQYNVTGTRIVAAFIDIAVLIALFVVMALVWGDSGKTTSENGADSYHMYLTGGPFLIYVAASFGYYVLLEGLIGTTLGKVVMGLRVVAIDGSRCSWSAALVRNLLRIVDGLPVFYLVGFIAVAVNEKKQRIGDLAAKTLVVRT